MHTVAASIAYGHSLFRHLGDGAKVDVGAGRQRRGVELQEKVVEDGLTRVDVDDVVELLLQHLVKGQA